MMDTNENVLDGVLSRMFAADDIKLQEAVYSVSPGQGPKTHFQRLRIDRHDMVHAGLELRGAA